MLGNEVFNDDVKAAVAEAYFFLADIFIAKEEGMKQEKEESEGGDDEGEGMRGRYGRSNKTKKGWR